MERSIEKKISTFYNKPQNWFIEKKAIVESCLENMNGQVIAEGELVTITSRNKATGRLGIISDSGIEMEVSYLNLDIQK